MGETCHDKPMPMTRLQKRIEVNPLIRFLALAEQDGRLLAPNSQIKRVIFSPDGGRLLQALAQAGRVRVNASLAFLECAGLEMSADAIIAFLTTATDNEILEKVLEKVDGRGTLMSPGLKAALKKSGPLEAHAIGILNRLIGKGCNVKAALEAASPNRHLKVRTMLGFAESYEIHPLARLAVHLCSSDREVLALDSLIRRLEERAPEAVPPESALLKLESFAALSNLLKSRIQRYRGPIPVPAVSHPRLEWINSIPRLHAVGKAFRNCLSGSITYPAALVLGRSFIAVYTTKSTPRPVPFSAQYVLHVAQGYDGQARVFTILDAKGAGNNEIADDDLAEALCDLRQESGHVWRLSDNIVMDELLLNEWQNAFVD